MDEFDQAVTAAERARDRAMQLAEDLRLAEQRIGELESELERCRNPARGLLGWNIEDARFGARRLYATWRNRDRRAAEARAIAEQDRAVLVSIKPPGIPTQGLREVASGRYDAELLSWFVSLPRRCDVAFYHEPENDGVDPEAYRSAFDRVASLLPSEQRPVVCLMAWTWDPRSGRRPEDWLPDGARALAVDAYNRGVLDLASDAYNREARELSELCAGPLEAARGRGLPLLVWETNSFGEPAYKAGWLRRAGDWAQAERIEHLTFFDGGLWRWTLLDSPEATEAVEELLARPYFGG